MVRFAVTFTAWTVASNPRSWDGIQRIAHAGEESVGAVFEHEAALVGSLSPAQCHHPAPTIVLDVEGLDPGTKFLSTFSRHLPNQSERAELARDLEKPQNRWVIKAWFAEGSDLFLPALPPSYELLGRWRRHEIWERTERENQEPTIPAFRDGFEVGDTSSWSSMR